MLPVIVRTLLTSNAVTEELWPRKQTGLVGSLFIALVAVLLATVSKRTPLTAAVINAAYWAVVLATVNLHATGFSLFMLLLDALFAFYCYRAFKVAREIRLHTPVPTP